MPTPARAAISRTGASTPEVANTVVAASSSASMLRRASARTRRPALSPVGLPVTLAPLAYLEHRSV